MGSKKHKKHSKNREEDVPMPLSVEATTKTGLKLVLKVGANSPRGLASVGSNSNSNSNWNNPNGLTNLNSPAPHSQPQQTSSGTSVSQSTTPTYHPITSPNPGISLRLVANPDQTATEGTKKSMDPLLSHQHSLSNGGSTPLLNGHVLPSSSNGGAASVVSGGISDSLSESSHSHHKHKKSEKKKKKKKKHHHHHCHHHKDHHHKHHHSDECRKRKHGERGEGEVVEEEEEVVPPKRPHVSPESTIDNQPPLPEEPLRDPIGVSAPRQAQKKSSLQELLSMLLALLQKRDVHQFFAWPVNDAIAPGYSTIISRPMDFSTIKRFIEQQHYATLDEFRADVKLICDNATTYNHKDTIYYKEAKKLWRHAQRITSKEHILTLDPQMKIVGQLSIEELGFDIYAKDPDPEEEEVTPRLTRTRAKANDDPVEGERDKIVTKLPFVVLSQATTPSIPRPVQEKEPIVEKPMPQVVLQEKENPTIVSSSPVVDTVCQNGTLPSKTAEPVVTTPPSTPVAVSNGLKPKDKESPVAPVKELSVTVSCNGDVSNHATAPQASPMSTQSNPAASPRMASPGLARKSKPDEDISELEPPSDDASGTEILLHAQRMARTAANKLTMHRPNTNFAFLRQNEDGSTTLNFLNPDITLTDRYPSFRPTEPIPPKKVDLEMLIGKLPYGMGNLIDFRDEIKNIAKPINYFPQENGTPPFATYAPHYDSTFSNLTKNESDLVYATYGDELGVQYAESIMHFAKDCDYVLNMVDNLLDTLTAGEHKKTLEKIKSGELLADGSPNPNALMNGPAKPTEHLTNGIADHVMDGNVDSPLSQSVVSPGFPHALLNGNVPGLMNVIETSHLNGVVNGEMPQAQPQAIIVENGLPPAGVQGASSTPQPTANGAAGSDQRLQLKLQESTEMIERLTKLQRERLSQTPPAHLGNVQGPSQVELELAEKLAATLSELASHAKPGSIVSVDAIRKAMGISLTEKKS